MTTTVSMDLGSPTRSRPTAAELASAMQVIEQPGFPDIVSASWVEIESYCGRLWGARAVRRDFRLVIGSAARAFPLLPIADSVTLQRWQDGAWASAAHRYEPDGILRDLVEGSLYRVSVSNLGDLSGTQPPKNVIEAVLRLSAWRASHRGGLFLPLSDPTPAGYMLVDAIRRSGASELLSPYQTYFSGD